MTERFKIYIEKEKEVALVSSFRTFLDETELQEKHLDYLNGLLNENATGSFGKFCEIRNFAKQESNPDLIAYANKCTEFAAKLFRGREGIKTELFEPLCLQ